MLKANAQETYTEAGKPTLALLRLLQDYERRLQVAEDKLTAIAAVTKPAGGVTTDAEARTAIDAIIDGAA